DKLPSGAQILDEAGATPLDPNAEQHFYDRTWAEPSLDINGIHGGKPEFVNTTLVVEAEARFTIRLAPGQDPDTVGHAAEKPFRSAVPGGAWLTSPRSSSATASSAFSVMSASTRRPTRTRRRTRAPRSSATSARCSRASCASSVSTTSS